MNTNLFEQQDNIERDMRQRIEAKAKSNAEREDKAKKEVMIIEGRQAYADHVAALEAEMTIIACPAVGVMDDDGTATHYEHVAYLSEYPEEGAFPLGDEVTPNAKVSGGGAFSPSA